MTNRREFIHRISAAAAVVATPFPLSAKAPSEAHLPTRPIPGTGEPLPIVGLGNSVAFKTENIELSRRLLGLFLEKGGGYVDALGPSRFNVGRIMKESKAQDQLFVGNYISGLNEEAGLEEIKALQRSHGGALDLLQTAEMENLESRWRNLRQWKDDGSARYIGVARHNKRYYDAIMNVMKTGTTDFVQINYSMLETEAEEQLLPMALDKGIAVVINRPFVNGEYFPLVKGKALPEWTAEFDCHSWAQFSLKFILAHPAVNCVITETANPEHLLDNLGAGFGRLPDEKTRKRMLEHLSSL